MANSYNNQDAWDNRYVNGDDLNYALGLTRERVLAKPKPDPNGDTLKHDVSGGLIWKSKGTGAKLQADVRLPIFLTEDGYVASTNDAAQIGLQLEHITPTGSSTWANASGLEIRSAVDSQGFSYSGGLRVKFGTGLTLASDGSLVPDYSALATALEGNGLVANNGKLDINPDTTKGVALSGDKLYIKTGTGISYDSNGNLVATSATIHDSAGRGILWNSNTGAEKLDIDLYGDESNASIGGTALSGLELVTHYNASSAGNYDPDDQLRIRLNNIVYTGTDTPVNFSGLEIIAPTDIEGFGGLQGGLKVKTGDYITFDAAGALTVNYNDLVFNFGRNSLGNGLQYESNSSKVSVKGALYDSNHTGAISVDSSGVDVHKATSNLFGVSKLFSNTVQEVAANSVTATAGRTYGVQMNSVGQLVVNVPWENNYDTWRPVQVNGNDVLNSVIDTDEILNFVNSASITIPTPTSADSYEFAFNVRPKSGGGLAIDTGTGTEGVYIDLTQGSGSYDSTNHTWTIPLEQDNNTVVSIELDVANGNSVDPGLVLTTTSVASNDDTHVPTSGAVSAAIANAVGNMTGITPVIASALPSITTEAAYNNNKNKLYLIAVSNPVDDTSGTGGVSTTPNATGNASHPSPTGAAGDDYYEEYILIDKGSTYSGANRYVWEKIGDTSFSIMSIGITQTTAIVQAAFGF